MSVELRQLAMLVEQHGCVLWAYAPQSRRLTFVSPGVEQLTGYGAAELRQRTDLLELLVHPDDREPLLAALTGRRPVELECRIISRSGDERRVCSHILRSQAEEGGDGVVIGSTGGAATAQRLPSHPPESGAGLAQERGRRVALGQAFERLTRCHESSEVLAVVRDSARRIVECDGVSVLLKEGNELHFVEEDAIAPLWLGQRWPLRDCLVDDPLRSGRPTVVEDVRVDPRVANERYEATFVRGALLVPIRPGAALGALGAYWAVPHRATAAEIGDLSALADAAAVSLENARLYQDLQHAHLVSENRADELAAWKRRFEAATTAGSHILFELEGDGARGTWTGLEQVLGERSPRGSTGFAWWLERVHEQDRARVAAACQEALARHGNLHVEYRVRQAQGAELRVLQQGAWFALRQDGEGRLVGFISDVSRQRELEERVRHVEKMEAVGQLAGGVAHEFNNLLIPILAHGELALAAEDTPDAMRGDLRTMLEAAGRARELVQQLLAFSRKQILDEQRFSLSEEVRSVEKMLRRVLREDIELRLELAPASCLVRADRVQVQQILMNLAINAQDAMPSGGVLRITTSEVEGEGSEELPSGRYARLMLLDTGRGIDEATLERIFEPFFTTKERGCGSGLGLATVYGIVQQHGGHIACRSTVGVGTLFEVLLPLATEPPSDASVRSEPCEPHDALVLVVEDEPLVLELAERILSRSGYRVRTATDLEEALQCADPGAGALDLVLADLVLRRSNGRAVYARLRELHPRLKVLFMSGYAPDRADEEALASHRAPLLSKPFGVTDLLNAVREALRAPTPADEEAPGAEQAPPHPTE